MENAEWTKRILQAKGLRARLRIYGGAALPSLKFAQRPRTLHTDGVMDFYRPVCVLTSIALRSLHQKYIFSMRENTFCRNCCCLFFEKLTLTPVMDALLLVNQSSGAQSWSFYTFEIDFIKNRAKWEFCLASLIIFAFWVLKSWKSGN